MANGPSIERNWPTEVSTTRGSFAENPVVRDGSSSISGIFWFLVIHIDTVDVPMRVSRQNRSSRGQKRPKKRSRSDLNR